MTRANAGCTLGKSRCFHLVLISAVVLITVACARATRVESEWAAGAVRNQTFRKILVVGVTPAYNTRCRFERMMVQSLEDSGAGAVTSCSRMTSKDPLTRDAIVQLVSELGVDGVLATRLVDGKVGTVAGGSEDARGETYYKPQGYGYAYDPYYGSFGVPVAYGTFVAEDPSLTLRRTVVVSTNLYKAADATLVYTLDTAAYDKKSQSEIIDAVTTAIVQRLQRDGLL